MCFRVYVVFDHRGDSSGQILLYLQIYINSGINQHFSYIFYGIEAQNKMVGVDIYITREKPPELGPYQTLYDTSMCTYMSLIKHASYLGRVNVFETLLLTNNYIPKGLLKLSVHHFRKFGGFLDGHYFSSLVLVFIFPRRLELVELTKTWLKIYSFIF